MRKMVAFALAILLVVSSSAVAFAYTAITPSAPLSQFDIGGGNFVVPVDLSGVLDEYKDKLFSPDYYKVFRFGAKSSNSYFYLYVDFFDNQAVPACSTVYVSGKYSTALSFVKSHSVHWQIVFSYDSDRECYVVYRAPVELLPTTGLVLGGSYAPDTISYVSDFEVEYHSTCKVLSASSLTLVECGASSEEKTLTINYQYSNGTPAADSVTRSLAPGTEYSIPSPEVEGYTPNQAVVTGTMPEEDLTITVTYTKAFYPLTVKYQYEDSSKAAEDVSFQYPLGFVYDIPSPEITGYKPDKLSVSGTMPGRALEELVTYTKVPGGSGTGGSPGDGGDGSGGEEKPPGPGGDEGNGGNEGGGGSSGGDNPFQIPSQPPFSGYDPFIISGLPSWSGYDPFVINGLPPYSYDPFIMPKN